MYGGRIQFKICLVVEGNFPHEFKDIVEAHGGKYIYSTPNDIAIIPVEGIPLLLRTLTEKYHMQCHIPEKELKLAYTIIQDMLGPEKIKLLRKYEKRETIIDRKGRMFIVVQGRREYMIMLDDVRRVYIALKHLDADRRKIKTRELAEQYARLKGLWEYFTQTPNGKIKFKWEEFFGARKHYIPFQLCIRILEEYYHAVEYDRKGYIKLLKYIDEFET